MVNMVLFIKNKQVARLSPLDIILETTTVRKYDRLYTRVYSMLLANWTRPQGIVQWHFHHYLLCVIVGGFLRTLSVESEEAARLNKLGVNYLKTFQMIRRIFFVVLIPTGIPSTFVSFHCTLGCEASLLGFIWFKVFLKLWNNFVQSL